MGVPTQTDPAEWIREQRKACDARTPVEKLRFRHAIRTAFPKALDALEAVLAACQEDRDDEGCCHALKMEIRCAIEEKLHE